MYVRLIETRFVSSNLLFSICLHYPAFDPPLNHQKRNLQDNRHPVRRNCRTQPRQARSDYF
jgi:hypothetical protein